MHVGGISEDEVRSICTRRNLIPSRKVGTELYVKKRTDGLSWFVFVEPANVRRLLSGVDSIRSHRKQISGVLLARVDATTPDDIVLSIAQKFAVPFEFVRGHCTKIRGPV